MKILLFSILLVLFISCSTVKPHQVTTNNPAKNIKILPVYVYYKNTPPADSINEQILNLIRENNIQIITKQELQDINDREIKRASGLVFQRNVSDAEHALKDISSEQKYVANMLSIDFNYPHSVIWQNIPSPFKLDGTTKAKSSEIDLDKLKDKSMKDVLTFVVGMILSSGELR